MDLPGPGDHNVRGQVGVQGVGQALRRDGGAGAKIGHVGPGMDARVGPAAAGDVNPVAHHRLGRRLQGPGHGDQVLLHLPAVIRRAQIGQK